MNRALPWIPALVLIALGAAARAQTPPTAPLDLVAVGRCVWDKLTPAQRAPMIAASESANQGDMTKAQNTIPSVAWYRLIDTCDSRGVDDDHALAMISAMTIQESEGALLVRDTGLTREAIDEAVAAAPAESAATLQKIVHDRAAGGGPTPIAMATAAVLPIATALKIPEPDKFLATPAGRRLMTYCLDYYQTRMVAVGGVKGV